MTLFEDYVRRTEREHLDELSEAIRRSVAPFNPGDIFLTTETLMSTGDMLVHVSCRNWPFAATVLNITRLDLVRYPEDAYLHVMRMIQDHFNNLEYVTPESHIELGEN